jgi:hypothetical protein
MNKTYYSKAEDGSFHPITLNQTLSMYIDDTFINGMILFGSFLLLWSFWHSMSDR